MLKKIIVGLALISVITLLAGCDEYNFTPRSEEQGIEGSRFLMVGRQVDDVQLLRDQQTGCQYLVLYKSSGVNGMSPLLDENGKPTGCKNLK